MNESATKIQNKFREHLARDKTKNLKTVKKYLRLSDKKHKDSVEQLIDKYKTKELKHIKYEKINAMIII